jgi:hypothetical protein
MFPQGIAAGLCHATPKLKSCPAEHAERRAKAQGLAPVAGKPRPDGIRTGLKRKDIKKVRKSLHYLLDSNFRKYYL